MVIVGLFLKGEKASLYVTDEVYKFIKSFESKDRNNNIVNKAVKKLKYLADGGFEVTKPNIRYEGDGVYRIEIENTGRIIGFYDKGNFIGIKYFHKKSQSLTRIQKGIIKKVQRIYGQQDWMISISQ